MRRFGDGISSRKIPAAVGMAADGGKILYEGAFGTRDPSGVPVKIDSIFAIASMTKAITTTAAMQLVEQGKVELDEPVSKHLPQLEKLDVLDGFDPQGNPILRPSSKRHHAAPPAHAHFGILLRHLGWRTVPLQLCHGRADRGKIGPLGFEPGSRWQYGQGVDWAGRLVEKVSGMSLEEYFQAKILRPLEMPDTSYILPAAKFDRLVSSYSRQPDGTLKQGNRTPPAPPKAVQWRRRPLLHRGRLCALHADDPGQGPRREQGADPAGRRRSQPWRPTRSAR